MFQGFVSTFSFSRVSFLEDVCEVVGLRFVATIFFKVTFLEDFGKVATSLCDGSDL